MERLALGVLLFLTSILLPSNVASLENGIDIYSLHVDSKVTSRFAHSTITSKVVNRANESQEAVFEVELPKTAFITNFSMTIDGVKYPGMIHEKKAAQERYDKAISRGQSAGLVKATGRMLEKFQVSVNVASAGKVTFELIYEELLKRKLGKYQLLIKVKPKQLVKHFQIDVHIVEPQGLLFLDSSSTFMTNELSKVLTKTTSETEAHVSFKPTIDQQRKGPGLDDSILDGDLMINYDVRRSKSAGDVQIINGYFVHYFAPAQMPTLPKNVVFVVDRSGSMYGRKIAQTREALLKILEDISPEDHFNVITFSSSVSKWKNSMLKATEHNIREAKAYVEDIHAEGATDINKALLTSIKLLDEAMESRTLPERSISMIVLLTDGEPTVGETNIGIIQANVRRANEERYTLYCLGFGFDLDYKFLEKMALENGGMARRIYEDSDSALQLQGFYQEVANPILMKIQLEYPDNSISHLTENKFQNLFDGSEIVVAGKIEDNDIDVFAAEISAQAHASDLVFNVEENIAEKEEALKKNHYVFGDFIERLWAYLTIEQLLEKVILANREVRKNLEQQALQLSLKYSFVTTLTSMVVTKPEEQDKPMVANKPTEDSQGQNEEAVLHGRRAHSSARFRLSANHGMHYLSRGHHKVPGVHRKTPMLTMLGLSDDSLPIVLPSVTVPPQSTTDRSFPTTRINPSNNAEYPNFIIQFPDKQDSICLNIIGEQNSTMNLIADPDMGIRMNGTMGQLGNQKRNCVSFEITYKDPAMVVSVSKNKITLQSIKGKTIMYWGRDQSIVFESMRISVEKKMLTITADGKIVINIFYPWPPKRCPGLHLMDVNHFSHKVTGLIGQFYSNTTVDLNSGENQNAQEKTLTVQGQMIQATRILVKNYKTSANMADTISCWLVNLNQN